MNFNECLKLLLLLVVTVTDITAVRLSVTSGYCCASCQLLCSLTSSIAKKVIWQNKWENLKNLPPQPTLTWSFLLFRQTHGRTLLITNYELIVLQQQGNRHCTRQEIHTPYHHHHITAFARDRKMNMQDIFEIHWYYTLCVVCRKQMPIRSYFNGQLLCSLFCILSHCFVYRIPKNS